MSEKSGKRHNMEDSPFRVRLGHFYYSVVASRVLAKIGQVSLEDIPNNFPKVEQEKFWKAANKFKEEGLQWEKEDENTHVARLKMDEIEEG